MPGAFSASRRRATSSCPSHTSGRKSLQLSDSIFVAALLPRSHIVVAKPSCNAYPSCELSAKPEQYLSSAPRLSNACRAGTHESRSLRGALRDHLPEGTLPPRWGCVHSTLGRSRFPSLPVHPSFQSRCRDSFGQRAMEVDAAALPVRSHRCRSLRPPAGTITAAVHMRDTVMPKSFGTVGSRILLR
jgi:hypothetical protein